MKFGLHIAGAASVCQREALLEMAALAEDLGYDSILMGDHIALPRRITTPSISVAKPALEKLL